jgi:hypothetical protein
MSIENKPTRVNFEVRKERSDFHKLIAGNPNYFGNLKQSAFKPVFTIGSDTTYEELTCIGFNPASNVLEAVIQIKQPGGYGGNPCGTGSFEYVRFFVDYGSGWEDAGLAAVHINDIATANDCAGAAGKPLSYAASVQIQPKSNWCFFPVLPKVRAILSWQQIPTAGDADFPPVWGNVLERHIQIRPRLIFFEELATAITKDVQQVLGAEQLSAVAKMPVPLPDPGPVDLAQLTKLYSAKHTRAAAVPSHRFGFAELHAAMKGPDANAASLSASIAKWSSLGLNWQSALGALGEIDANVSYEQLECLGMEGDSGLERLVATFRIKQPGGYGGGLCTAGSTEYVAFWADWDNTCQYTYLGTVPVQVHDIAAIPADGLSYTAVLPVDVGPHRDSCDKPKIARVRAVLSWAVPPSTVDPDALDFWGNRIDTHVQIRPGDAPNALTPKMAILGGIPTSFIDGSGLTTVTAIFAGTNFPADQWNLGRQCPFGGRVEVQGYSFPGFKYRIQVKRTAGGSWQDVSTPLWLTRWDGTVYQVLPDPQNFFDYQQHDQNIENLLGLWDTSGDDQWFVKLEIADMADNPILGAVPDIHVMQLDNTAPEAAVHIDSGGDCGKYAVGVTLNGHFVGRDSNFGGYSLGTLPFSGPISPTGGTVQTAVAPGDAWTLNTTGMTPCGYVIELDVSDRSIVNSAYASHNGTPASAGFCLLEKV